MKKLAAVGTVLLIGLALVLNASFQQPGSVEVFQLAPNNWDEAAPSGKEVDAIYGDIVLRNEHVVAVIAQPLASRHANMTVKDVGGCLIDLTTRDQQSDQLSAFYPGSRRNPFRQVEILGEQAKPVALKAGYAKAGKLAMIRVTSKGTETRPAVAVTYGLYSGSRTLIVRSRFVNESTKPLDVPLEDDMRIDSGKEDTVKSPNGTSDLYFVHDRYWGQAYGFAAPGFELVSNSNSRTSTLRYESEAANRKVTLKPGESFELTRHVIAGTDLPDVRAVALTAKKEKAQSATFEIVDALKNPVPNARITLRRGDSEWGSLQTDKNGVGRTRLPAGEYALQISALGVEISPDKGALRVSVGDSPAAFQLSCPKWKPGRVVVRIRDGSGDVIPCKIEFFAKGETPQPSFGPDTADFAMRGLHYVPRGELETELPAGEYEAVIAHGPEYDSLVANVTVKPGETTDLKAKLTRVVDTTGWISSDFHSHSSPSGDNTGSQLGRVLNLIADQIEFAPCTEHNRISDYQPHIDRLGVGQFIGTCTGMELTGQPLPLNHQNSFPLKHKPRTQDGGGPVTDVDVEKQIERLAFWDNRSEKLVQINHPDMGWLFRDRDGNQEPDEGHARILPHIDVIEIHPVPDILTLDPFTTVSNYKSNNRIFNWLQFLNQGRRFVGVVNTDAHYNYHESGWIRNWIRSPTDEPSQIKTMDVVRAAEAGAVIMSNGPFLTVDVKNRGARSGVFAGQELASQTGEIEVDVRVQCPNWIEIDRVFLLVNGRILDQHHYRKATHPNLFRSGVVRFAEKLSVKLKSDAHLIVVAGGEKSKLGRAHGPVWGEHPPAAFHNPIYVDVGSDGFKANGDTLGRPLPVKFVPPKK